jgi:hypothetical protein
LLCAACVWVSRRANTRCWLCRAGVGQALKEGREETTYKKVTEKASE